MKKLFILLSFIIILIVAINCPVFASNASYSTYVSGYGFAVTGDITPLIEDSTTGFISDSTIKYSQEKKEHETSYVLSYFSFDDAPEIKGIIYRVTTKPYQPGRHWGFLGIGSYGDDFLQDSVSVKMELPDDAELMSYAPMAKPTSQTISVGASISSDGNVGISIDYSYTIEDLTIINDSSIISKLYNITYDYNEKNWNAYTTGELFSYGMLIFKYSGRRDIPVNINVKYHDYNGYEGSLSSVDYSFNILN